MRGTPRAKLEGIDLGDIEYYHRLRNTVYHEGDGIAVEPEKVEAYLEIARLLLLSLFGTDVRGEVVPEPTSSLGTFLAKWAELEKELRRAESRHVLTAAPTLFDFETQLALFLEPDRAEEVRELRQLRNRLAHGEPASVLELEHGIRRLEAFARTIRASRVATPMDRRQPKTKRSSRKDTSQDAPGDLGSRRRADGSGGRRAGG